MIRRRLIVRIDEGVHLRVATAIVELVGAHSCELSLEHEGQSANAKSAIEVLALGMVPGAEVQATASGDEGALVMEALAAMLESPTPLDTQRNEPSDEA